MHDDHDSPAAWLFGLLSRLAILLQVLLMLAGILIVFYGVWFSHCKQRVASCLAETIYWRLRFWGFAIGAYAIVLFFWAVLHASGAGVNEGHHLFDYWPAVCMFWTDDSWFGAAGHRSAVEYESVFMGCVACVVAATARIAGSYDADGDFFTPTR
jgi:hypothetical protein